MSASPKQTLLPASAGTGAAWVQLVEQTIIRAAEIPATILLVVEVTVILLGVVSRYVFGHSIFWVDELASLLFVWISMLGAVVALGRDEHMRLTTVLNAVSPVMRRRLQAAGSLLIVVAAVLLVPPAYRHYEQQQIVTMITLGVSEGVRAAALMVGAALLSLCALLRLFALAERKEVAGAVVAAVLLFGGLWLARPLWIGMGNYNLVAFFVVLLGGLIAIGLPIPFTFILCTASYLLTTTHMPLLVMVSRMEDGMSNLVLLAIPLFIFLGLLIEATGFARALVTFMAMLVGHLRGGMSFVLLGAMFLVSGISGSKAADMAAVAPGLVPEMRRRGAADGELAAQLGASAVMTETIPPSLVLIMIGSTTGISISALFAGGLIPAVLCTAALVIVVYLRAAQSGDTRAERAKPRQVAKACLAALPALALPVVIRSAVVEGIATATEVSTIGVVYTLAIGALVYRRLSWRTLYPVLVATVSLTGAVLLILSAAIAMSWALTQSGFARQLVAAMTALPGGRAGFLAASIAGFIVLGSVLEGLPAILVFAPVLFPASRALGINDIQYSMVIVISMGLGLYAPPLGIGYYSACAIARTSPDAAMRRIWPYLGALLLALVVIAAVPWFSTVLLEKTR